MTELIRKFQDQDLNDSIARVALMGSITVLGVFLLLNIMPEYSARSSVSPETGLTSFWKGFSILTSQPWLALSVLLLGFADHLNRDRLNEKIFPFFFMGLGLGFSFGSLGLAPLLKISLSPLVMGMMFALLIFQLLFRKRTWRLFSLLFAIAGLTLGGAQGSTLSLDLYPSLFAFGLGLGYVVFLLIGYGLPRLLRHSLRAVVDF